MRPSRLRLRVVTRSRGPVFRSDGTTSGRLGNSSPSRGPASSGTSISALVSEPWAPTSRRSPGIAGSTKADRRVRQERGRRRGGAGARRGRAPGPEPPVVDQLVSGHHPRNVTELGTRRGGELVGGRRVVRRATGNRPSPLQLRTSPPSGARVVPVVADVDFHRDPRSRGPRPSSGNASRRRPTSSSANSSSPRRYASWQGRTRARRCRPPGSTRRSPAVRAPSARTRQCSTSTDVVLQPWNGTSRRCAAVKPDVRNSRARHHRHGAARGTAGGVARGRGRAPGLRRPSNAGTFSTPPSTRDPEAEHAVPGSVRGPWVIEVSAEAVGRRRHRGDRAAGEPRRAHRGPSAWAASSSQPSPSRHEHHHGGPRHGPVSGRNARSARAREGGARSVPPTRRP